MAHQIKEHACAWCGDPYFTDGLFVSRTVDLQGVLHDRCWDPYFRSVSLKP